jgi:hypothetical protein
MSADPAATVAALAASAGVTVAAERLRSLGNELAENLARADRLRPLLAPADEAGPLDLRPFQNEAAH